MFKVIFLFCLMLLSWADQYAQKTIISGIDTAHAGRQIAAFTIADYISGKRDLMAQTRIGDDGRFSLELELKQTREVQLVVLHLQASLFAEPGTYYNIELLPEANSNFKRLDKTKIELKFLDAEPDELNLLIRQFDYDYYHFVNAHYYDFAAGEAKNAPEFVSKRQTDMVGHSPKSDSLKKMSLSNFSALVTTFMDYIHKKYDAYQDNEFFKQYMRYSLAEIELTAGLNKKIFYRQYFMSQNMLHSNPAYMRVFSTFYYDILTSQTKEKNNNALMYVNAQRNAQKLIEMFSSDSTMLGETIRTAAVIKGLKDAWNHKDFLRPSIIKTLKNLASITNDEELAQIANNTIYQLQRNKEGWHQENFILLDEREEKWILNEHTGIPVYILFFANWSAPSVKEMLLLEKLSETYENDVLIVAINMDEDYKEFKKYLYEHPKQKFTMLYGYDNILLKENFDLKSIPHAVMLTPELKVMSNYTPLPSQGIQSTFAKLKQESTKGSQSPKTWTDKD